MSQTRSNRVRLRRFRVALAALAVPLVALITLVGPAPAASAHDYLVSSSPKADSTQSAPLDEVSLTFSDVVLNLSSTGSTSLLTVTDDAGLHYETGCALTRDRVVSAQVALGDPGRYTVEWQVVSADGHTVSGDYTFEYAPPAGTAHADGTTSSACRGDAGGGNETGATDTDAASTAPIAIVLVIVGVIVALLIIGVVIVLLATRRGGRTRRGPPRDDDEDA